jgi:hypothetical protein
MEHSLQSRVIAVLADEIGPRPATSTAEARAAALVAAQMRQVGLEVGVQTFAAAAAPTAGLGLLAAIGMAAALLGWWLPWPSIVLVVLLIGLAGRELNGPPTLAALLRRRPSQNVIGTRAAERPPRSRIILLSHLDSPRIATPRWGKYLRWSLLIVPGELLILLLLLAGRVIMPAAAPLLLLPLLLLAASATLIWWRERRAEWSRGAVDAAALATTLAVAETQLADDVELWVVALGAGAAAGAGLHALLDVYPFPTAETWFINLPWLGRGTLTLVTGEGLWRERPTDPHLSQIFHDLQSVSAPLIRRPYRGERLDSARLLARGYHAISLVGLRADGTAAGFRHADDSSGNLEPRELQTAVVVLQRALARFNRGEQAAALASRQSG